MNSKPILYTAYSVVPKNTTLYTKPLVVYTQLVHSGAIMNFAILFYRKGLFFDNSKLHY